MEKDDIPRQHCPEVERLMKGKMPFITRYGITLVTLVISIIIAIMLFSEGTPQQLMKGMIEHTIGQITSKYK